jgi:hypothetical protein
MLLERLEHRRIAEEDGFLGQELLEQSFIFQIAFTCGPQEIGAACVTSFA